MDIELLGLKTIHEIRALATEKGLRWAKTEKKVDLIERIAEIPERQKPKQEEPVKVEVAVYTASQEEILAAIDENLKAGLKIKFYEDGWHMRSPQGREDSGSYTAPLSVVKKLANFLVRP